MSHENVRASTGAAGSTPVKIVTVTTPAMLPQARVLRDSIARHHPSWAFEAVLLGRSVGEPAERGLAIVEVEEELGLDPERLLLHHGEHELVTILVPRVLRRRLDHGIVIHLPPTAWSLGPLDPLVEPLLERPVLLAPRVTRELPEDGLEPTPDQLFQTGRVATNLMGIGSTAAGDFLHWWIKRLDESLGSPDGRHPGLRAESRHWVYYSLNLARIRWETATLADPGSNLSAWNIPEHTFEPAEGEVIVDGHAPLRLIDLAGFDPGRPFQLRPHSSRIRLSRLPALRNLVSEYASALRAAGWDDPLHRCDGGQWMPNGLRFDDNLQALFTVAHAVGGLRQSPLCDEGAEQLVQWLRGPAVRGGRAGVNRYVLHRVLHERADVVQAFPDLDGIDGAGLVAWCFSSGQREMEIPDLLMPEARQAREVVADSLPDLGEPPAPEPAAAEPIGVRVSGYLGHVLGLGAAARGYAQALAAAGVPVSTAAAPLDHLQIPGERSITYGRHDFVEVTGDGRHAFELICVNPDELPRFVDRLGPDYLSGTRIGVWAWETNSIPSRWAPAFGLVDEVWTYSRFVAENLGASAGVPVVALPPPVKAPALSSAPLRLGVPEGFLFLFVFDYSSTVQRKNPVGLIEAFKRAFPPGEGPQLLLKTINAPAMPLSEEEVLWAAGGRPDIHVIDRSLSVEERDALMASCDCYVSLHRSEGFGLTMAEAMAIGKPVIATGYSGNVDFMNEGNSYLVEYELARVGADCQIYPADGEWAEPSVAHAAELMRLVHEDREGAARVGERARQDIARHLSPEATGSAMRRRLEQLTAERRSARPH